MDKQGSSNIISSNIILHHHQIVQLLKVLVKLILHAMLRQLVPQGVAGYSSL
jgi:hypothetical protein